MNRTCLTLSAIALVSAAAVAAAAPEAITVVQKGRDFQPKRVQVQAGDVIRFTNEDEFLHQIFVHSPGFSFDSDEQLPGQDVSVAFKKAGSYRVLCGIHPKMELTVDVR